MSAAATPNKLEVSFTNAAQPIATETDKMVNMFSIGIQGPPGPRGLPGASGADVSYISGQILSGHTAVALNSSGNCIVASCIDTATNIVVGVTTGASTENEVTTVKTSGVFEHLGWTFIPGQPIFLGLNGQLVQVLPVEAVFSKVIGFALSATTILVNIQQTIFI